MKLLSLISICHLAGVIALVTPVLATPLASPRDPIDQSLSEEEYTTIGQRLLQLGVIVSPEEVQFIHQIDSVYDQFRRPGPDVHRVLEAAFNWFRQMTNSDARSQALKVERANDRFVHCLKFVAAVTHSLQPRTLRDCDVEHPSASLRKAMEDGLFPRQLRKPSQARVQPTRITRD